MTMSPRETERAVRRLDHDVETVHGLQSSLVDVLRRLREPAV